MKIYKNGFTLVEAIIIIILICMVSFAGWFVLNNQSGEETSTTETTDKVANSESCDTKFEDQKSWKKVVSSEQSFSMCVAGGWTLASDTGSELFQVLAPFTISNTQDSIIEEKTTGGGDGSFDQFTIFKAENHYQGWTDENNYTVSGFTLNDGTEGSRYYTKWGVVGDGIGPVQEEEDYEYLFDKNGKYIHAIYTIMPGTSNELNSVEKVLKTLVIN